MMKPSVYSQNVSFKLSGLGYKIERRQTSWAREHKQRVEWKMNFSLLKEYGLMELWNPEVLLLFAVLGFLYLQVVGPWRHRFAGAEPVSSRQKGLFISGLTVYYLALGSPLDIIAHHYMFSAHIFQQSMMLFAAPPLILLGIPAWLVRPVFNHPGFKKPLAVLTQPIFAAFLFNAFLSFYHLPLIFDFATANEAFGTLYHTVLVITAFQVWWSITCPLPEAGRLSELKKMGYIVVNGLLLYPVCAVIIFSKKMLYSAYLDVPRLIPILQPLDDQQLGGVVMKLFQEGVFIVALGYLFAVWYRKENRDNFVEDAG